MNWKRRLAVGALAAGLGVGSHTARAEDSASKKADAPEAPVAPAEAPRKKDPFFGNHFAMYLETRGGPASIKGVRNPLSSSPQSGSESELNFNGNKTGQFTIGWTLPRGRGQYLLTYTGIADGDFELDATGMQQNYLATNSQAAKQIQFFLPWWQVTIRDGKLQATKTPPVWNEVDDANLNGQPDPSEMRFPEELKSELSSTTPVDLGNRIQTWDLYYRREYGGMKIRARWTAGLRYLNSEGAIATPAWLIGRVDTPGFGYSDGVQNDLIVLQQETTGYGPVGSGEIQFNFFRQRLTLFALARAAFLLESLHADSGAFTYLTRVPSAPGGVPAAYFPGAGRIQQDVSKSSWNTTFEAGIQVKLVEGFHLIVDWNQTGYLDTLLLPKDLSVPQNASQTALGTSARFVSRDFVVSTVNIGLSFQF